MSIFFCSKPQRVGKRCIRYQVSDNNVKCVSTNINKRTTCSNIIYKFTVVLNRKNSLMYNISVD